MCAWSSAASRLVRSAGRLLAHGACRRGMSFADGLGRQRLVAVGGDDEAAFARPAAGDRHPERLEEGDVLLGRAAQRRQVVADDEGVGPGVEAHALQLAEDLLPAAGQADPRPGQDQPEQGDGLQRFPGRQQRRVGQRRPGPGVEQVDRHLAGVELRQLEGEVDALLQRLADAHDPAAAQLHAGVDGQPGGGDPVVVAVGGADRREDGPGRLEVVVVPAHAGGGQALRLGRRPGARASRPPRGRSRSRTAVDGVDHLVEEPFARAPHGDHDAELGGAGRLRGPGRLQHLVEVEEGVDVDAGVEVGRLGAEGAVLGAGARTWR